MSFKKADYIVINEADNVAILRSDTLGFASKGQKVALENIASGALIIKYGVPIAVANSDIQEGEIVSHKNTDELSEANIATINVTSQDNFREVELAENLSHFDGFRNLDGSVGTRNYLCISTSVQCVSGVVDFAVKKVERELLPNFPNVDGVIVLNHSYGCGVAITAEGSNIPKRTLANLTLNPNFGNYLLLIGLGCEKLSHHLFLNNISKYDQKFLTSDTFYFQDVDTEGFESIVEKICKACERGLTFLNKRKRERCHISELKIGLQCGGSDAFSGITANPLLGYLSDLLVGNGGTTFFSENTECMDAEEYLLSRCADKNVAKKMRSEFEWYRAYLSYGAVDRMANTTPGNKAGGLTSITEKAMGSIAKSGNGTIVDVVAPGARVVKPGLNFLSGPASDFICGTLQLAAGANFHIFTTGRGTPYSIDGFPVLKVSSNSKLKQKWFDLIDFDAGSLLDSGDFHDEALKLLDLIIKIASGDKTCAEKLGIKNDIVLFNPAPVT